jgi:membrane protein implicated in regulation of membrane protease activity
VTSTLTIIAWYKIFKPQHQKALDEFLTSQKMIGLVGTLTKDLKPRRKGQVRFQEPHLGPALWDCKADEKIAADTPVKVVSAKGRLLKVSKADTPQ